MNRVAPRRVQAIVFSACVITALALYGAFFFAHIGHEHDHDGPLGGCSTCARIESTGRLFGYCVVALPPTVSGVTAAVKASHMPPGRTSHPTPVTLKARMNN